MYIPTFFSERLKVKTRYFMDWNRNRKIRFFLDIKKNNKPLFCVFVTEIEIQILFETETEKNIRFQIPGFVPFFETVITKINNFNTVNVIFGATILMYR